MLNLKNVKIMDKKEIFLGAVVCVCVACILGVSVYAIVLSLNVGIVQRHFSTSGISHIFWFSVACFAGWATRKMLIQSSESDKERLAWWLVQAVPCIALAAYMVTFVRVWFALY